MTQTQPMTFDEKLAIAVKSAELWQAGDEEGSIRLVKTAPMIPYLAKFFKEKVGADYLINGGWDLSEAEAEFGSDWLTR